MLGHAWVGCGEGSKCEILGAFDDGLGVTVQEELAVYAITSAKLPRCDPKGAAFAVANERGPAAAANEDSTPRALIHEGLLRAVANKDFAVHEVLEIHLASGGGDRSPLPPDGAVFALGDEVRVQACKAFLEASEVHSPSLVFVFFEESPDFRASVAQVVSEVAFELLQRQQAVIVGICIFENFRNILFFASCTRPCQGRYTSYPVSWLRARHWSTAQWHDEKA
mmetsp:Transcript_44091/g.92027  ORF Transcript_44091/g.92027 Transcript_44091/m.92027 type:complete len:224 (+) Transcript_44091:934-1605(+)